jgi:UDP-glucuronate 4-epimerase
MKKVLVTGSAGFIGMHLALKLNALGYDVVGLDNLNEYYDVNLKYARLAEQGIGAKDIERGKIIAGNKGIRFLYADLVDKKVLFNTFEKEQFDYVVHLAAQAGVRYSLENPDVYIKSNVEGFLNILECSRSFSVKHLVYASSSSVYGFNSESPFKELHNTDYPVSLYAATKKSNELMAHTYSHLYKLPTTGLRFFTVYGPFGRPDMALFKFTENILKGKPIDVYNYGNMYRDFTYIDDIVNGITKVVDKAPEPDYALEMDRTFSSTKAPYAIYNIGASQPVKLLDFISALEDALGKKAELNFMPMQPGDVLSTYADVSNLKDLVYYKPQTQIETGIRLFVNWYFSFFKR